MALKEQVPQELVVLAMQALADDERLRAQLDLAELRMAESDAPGLEPLRRDLGAVEAVVESCEQVRLTLAALADEDDSVGK